MSTTDQTPGTGARTGEASAPDARPTTPVPGHPTAILRDRHGRDVPVHVHDAHTTQNGLPVISIDGELWTVEPVREACHE